jgi:hypothetical protein
MKDRKCTQPETLDVMERCVKGEGVKGHPTPGSGLCIGRFHASDSPSAKF